jgi:DNA repair exonuclease SbcCD ATPase subunit
MQGQEEDHIQFTMRRDENVEEAVIPNQVDDLRIEKLNHRMTLISILIPVLIVVILGVAYLDIKRRVVRTEDSGQLTAQTLSEDLQSRFSSLSVGQAMIEENFSRLKDQTEQSIAKVQVNLKNLDDSVKKSGKSMASRSDMKATAAKMDKGLADLSLTIEALNQQLQTMTQSMQQQFGQLDQSLGDASDRMAGLEEKLTLLEEAKIDKASLDLALKLETLKLKQVFNARMDEIQSRMDESQSRIKALERQIAKLKASRRAQTPIAPKPAPSASPALEEQTIKQ